MTDEFKKAHEEERREDRALDRSLEDTLTGSDPSSVTRAPKSKSETQPPPRSGAGRQTPDPAQYATAPAGRGRAEKWIRDNPWAGLALAFCSGIVLSRFL